MPLILVPGSTCRGTRDTLFMYFVYVWSALQGRKHLLAEGSQEVLCCMCLYVSAHMFVSVSESSVLPSLLYPADLAVAHLPPGLRSRRLVASCSTHILTQNNITKEDIGKQTETHT